MPVDAAAIVVAAAVVDGVDIALLASIAGHHGPCSKKNSSSDYGQDDPSWAAEVGEGLREAFHG